MTSIEVGTDLGEKIARAIEADADREYSEIVDAIGFTHPGIQARREHKYEAAAIARRTR